MRSECSEERTHKSPNIYLKTLSLPKKDTQEAHCWTTAEMERFINASELKEDERYYLWMCGAMIGGRAGEYMALEWSDLDLDSDLPSVRFTKTRCQKTNQVFSGTKNGDSRTVDLIPDAVTLLRELKRKKVPAFPKNNVFDQSLDQGHFARDLKTACDKVGVSKITFHQLRHSFLTWLASKGVEKELISMMAGHRDGRVTDLYVHRSREMQKLLWERNKHKLDSLLQNSNKISDEGSDSGVI